MATLTIELSNDQKDALQMRASRNGSTISRFILESTGINTADEKPEAIRDYEAGRYEECSLDEFKLRFLSW